MENAIPIAERMARWKIKDSSAVAKSLAERAIRDLNDAERGAIKRWLPQMRYLTDEQNKRYPFYRTERKTWHDPSVPTGAYDSGKTAHAAAIKELDEIEQQVQDSHEEARNIRLSRAMDTDYCPPVPVGQALYPFQRAGVEYALGKRFVLLYDEMGLGKTPQAIVAINAHPSPGRILVVCPATLRENWFSEFARWSTRRFSYCIVAANTKEIPQQTDVVIVNYDLIWRRDFLGEFSTVILDEAHRAKNAKSHRAKAALHYLRQSGFALVLSGSPIPKDLTDLYAMVDLAMPDVGQRFFKDFVTSHTEEVPYRGGRGQTRTVVKHSGKNHTELGRLMRSRCMVRRLKKDVLPQLPPKTRQIVTLPDVRFSLDEKIKARLSQLMEGDDAYRRSFGKGKEQEIDGHIATVRHDQAVTKAPYVVDHVVELLKEDDTRKVVVFGYHKDVIRILVDGLSAFGCVSITGETPQKVRQTYVEAFQTGTSTRVFVGNIDAAGEGITLHAAALAVFAEIDWTWSKVEQAEDRIHRIGANGDKEGKILIQHVILAGSVDEMIVRSMLAKKRESDAVLS